MNLETGATGHIGNVLVRELVARGKAVRAMVMPGEDCASLEGLPVEVVEANVLDRPALDQVMRGVEVVYHLAAVISILPGKDEAVRRINIEGTHNVLQAARAAGVRRLLYTSSIHALSRTEHSGYIDESVPFDPQNPIGEYDRSKAAASLEVMDAVRDGLEAVVVCPTGVIGPHDYRSSEMGLLFVDWMEDKSNVLIDGAFDFVDVRDVATGMILAAEKGVPGDLYILSGEQISLVTMMKIVKALLRLPIRLVKIPLPLARLFAHIALLYYRFSHTKPRFTPYSVETVADSTPISREKARVQLGYNPRSLAVTIRDTIEWWRGHQKLVKVKAHDR